MCTPILTFMCGDAKHAQLHEYAERFNHKSKPFVLDDYDSYVSDKCCPTLESVIQWTSKQRDKTAVYVITKLKPCFDHLPLSSELVSDFIYIITKINPYITLDSELANWDSNIDMDDDNDNPGMGVSSNAS